MNMLHIQAKRLLSAYVDRALDASTSARIEKHLKTCPDCSAQLQEIRSGAQLASLGRDEIVLPENVRRRLEKSLHPVYPRRGMLKIGVVAALVILSIVAVYLRTTNEIRSDTNVAALDRALPLDLLVQEAASLRAEPEWDTEPYAKLARTKTELEDLTGQSYSEPQLPSEFLFVRGFVYQARYGGAIGRIYASNDGRQVIALFEQPRETPMAYPPRNPKDSSFLGKQCIEVRWPTIRLFSWVTGSRRTLLLSNMSTDQLQPLFVRYPGLRQ